MKRLNINNPELIKEQILSYFNKNNEAKFIHRLHGILLLIESEDNNCENVADLFNNSPRSLSNWVHKINKTHNIEVLRDMPKTGRKSRLSREQEFILSKIIHKSPSDFDFQSNKWTGELVSEYIKKEFSIAIKIRQCQRLLKKIKKE